MAEASCGTPEVGAWEGTRAPAAYGEGAAGWVGSGAGGGVGWWNWGCGWGWCCCWGGGARWKLPVSDMETGGGGGTDDSWAGVWEGWAAWGVWGACELCEA